MRSLIASFIVMVCLVSFTVGSVGATDVAPPNHPKLFDPNKVRFLAMGLPQGETRKWMDEIIPNDNGGIMALCLKYLTTQKLFPAAGPAFGNGMFCLANPVTVTPFQFLATGIVSHGRNPQTGEAIKIPAKKVLNCTILVENVTMTSSTSNPLLLHTVACTNEMQPPSFIGTYYDSSIEPINQGSIGPGLSFGDFTVISGDSR